MLFLFSHNLILRRRTSLWQPLRNSIKATASDILSLPLPYGDWTFRPLPCDRTTPNLSQKKKKVFGNPPVLPFELHEACLHRVITKTPWVHSAGQHQRFKSHLLLDLTLLPLCSCYVFGLHLLKSGIPCSGVFFSISWLGLFAIGIYAGGMLWIPVAWGVGRRVRPVPYCLVVYVRLECWLTKNDTYLLKAACSWWVCVYMSKELMIINCRDFGLICV